jgi:CheY-like chemotaxis protein
MSYSFSCEILGRFANYHSLPEQGGSGYLNFLKVESSTIKINHHKPDIIILDIVLPGCSQWLSRLSQTPETIAATRNIQ